MAPIKNVLVVGASGNIGTPIAAALAAAGFNVSVTTRTTSKATFPSSYQVVKIDDSYPHDELVKAFKGQDAVISTLTDTELTKKLVDAAIEAGVRRFIPSEFGSDTEHPAALALVPFFQAKVDVVKYLEAREAEIEWTAVSNGPFYDWGLDKAFVDIDVRKSTAKLTDGGKTKFSTSSLAHIGRFVAAALTQADKTANKFLYVESFTVSQLDILAAVEKATGKKFEIEHQDSETLIKNSQEAVKNGNFMGNFGLIQAVLFGEGKGGNHHDKAVRSMAELGIEQEDLQTETDKAVKSILG